MTLTVSFRPHGLAAYLPLKGGGRSARPTGSGSDCGSRLGDPLPTASRSTSPFQGEVKERPEPIA
jgi:hypothetical protein